MTQERIDQTVQLSRADSDVPSIPVDPNHNTPVLAIEATKHRIIGLDMARGLAIIGMLAAHLIFLPYFTWDDPSSWQGIASGHSSILFATLAGVSIGIMTSGKQPGTLSLLQARMKVATRAAIIILIGVILEISKTNIAIILTVYGVLFLAILPIVTWSIRKLVIFTSIYFLIANFLFFFFVPWRDIYLTSGLSSDTYHGTYPMIIWYVYLCVGLIMSRFNLRHLRTQRRIFLVGLLITIATAIASMLVPPPIDMMARSASSSITSSPSGLGSASWTSDGQTALPPCSADLNDNQSCDPYILDFGDGGDPSEPPRLPLFNQEAFQRLLDPSAHSGSPLEVMSGLGLAMTVIGGFLLLSRVRICHILLSPLAAMGSMALSVYCVHVVINGIASDMGRNTPSWTTFTIVSLVLCTVWKLTLGQGPLERLLSRSARQATQISASDIT